MNIFVILGPTASGKSACAHALSEKLNAPIINADAFQIYKDMNIGTAKIDKNDANYSKYYLIDIFPPTEAFNIRDYQKMFRDTLSELSLKYENIIVCGGSGLYIKSAIFDYHFNDEKEAINASSFDDKTNEELYAYLSTLDLDSAKKIHPHNRKRVIRAINIALNAPIKKSENVLSQQHKPIYENVLFLCLNPKRENLYQNINKRVDIMFEKGLIHEVKELLTKYENLSLTAKQAIGYKEVISYLNNQITLDECKELIKKNTRNYAKRQITFFKHQFDCQYFETMENLLEGVKNDR